MQSTKIIFNTQTLLKIENFIIFVHGNLILINKNKQTENKTENTGRDDKEREEKRRRERRKKYKDYKRRGK